MKIKFIFFVLLLILLNSVSNAQSRCDKFYDRVKNEYSSEDEIPQSVLKTLGFSLQVYYNEKLARITLPGDSKFKEGDSALLKDLIKINKELIANKKEPIKYDKGDWSLDKTKEGYFKVGKIFFQNLADKVKANDIIISANGKDLRNFDLTIEKNIDEIKKVEDFFKLNEDIELEIISFDKTGKKINKTVKTSLKEIKFSEPFLDFYLESVVVDEKNGVTEITLETEFEEIVTKDFAITKIARDELFYNLKGENWFEECPYTIAQWENLNTIDPNYGIVFNNLVSKDKSKLDEYYLITPSLVGTWPEIKEDSLSIMYKSKGVYVFKNQFNLRSFPFDKQKIKIFVRQSRYELGDYQASVSDWTKRRLIDYSKTENAIPGWNIVNQSVAYKLHKDVNYDTYYDGVEITLSVERKSSYYVFKVILPIILILMICWSAIWIDPKEIESRLTITIVCLLSLIAYNFVIDSDMPKLEYLTIMDYIILTSYIYAAVPNFLSVYSFQLIKKNKALTARYESYQKKYGLLSYISIIFLIIVFNASSAPEHTNSFFTWASMR